MDKKKKDDVDYAAAYHKFMNFGHGRSLKQFCEDEDYDYGKLQRYSRKAFWSKHTKLSESEVEESQFMALVRDDGQSISPAEEELLHYSSEEGVEMAMTYLTIIETAKMWGLQVKEYLAYVWREVMSGRSALPLVPKVSRILTTSQ